jgi:serine protease Do
MMIGQMNRNGHRIGWLAACALLAGAMASTGFSDEATPTAVTPQDLAVAESLSRVFRHVGEMLEPTVAHVEVTREVVVQSPFPQMPGNPYGDQFMRRFFGPDMRRRSEHGLGSGVVVDPDGYILTNNHVVNGAGKIVVKLFVGKPTDYEAKLIGADPDTDLALIKIEAHGLKAATLGDSSKMEVGDWVIAVGNPFGLDHTVTTGTISALGRRLHTATYESLIQSDAAINPGNSGGPLANIHGEVIGINASIASPSGAFAGIGMAIPSNMAKKVLAALKEKGKVTRGFLGVEMQTLTPDLAKSLGADGTEGVLIAQVNADSPAGKAGLKNGDIITKVKERAVTSPEDLQDAVASMSPGEKVSVEIVRDGKAQTVEVVLGERTAAALGEGEQPAPAAAFLGITVQDLTAEIAAQLGYKMNQGVVVAEVAAGSAAEQAGIRPGNLIEQVARKAVHSVAEYNAAVEAARSLPSVVFRVRSGKRAAYVVLPTK